MGYAAWLCDLDGTLYRPWPVKVAMGLEMALHGRAQLASIRAFRHQHEVLREMLDHDVPSPFELQLERAASEVGLSPDELRPIVLEWMIERPRRWIARFARRGFLGEIARFREGGGSTAVVSDYPARAKLVALGAAHLFDVVVANGEEDGPARLKPSADGYLRAARALRVAPAACLVIGDRDDADGQAARSAGMAFRRIGRAQ